MGTIDAFQRQVWSPQFKQNCFPHRSKMGVLKSFLRYLTGVVSSLRGELRRCPRFGSMRERPSQIASIEADGLHGLSRFVGFDQELEPTPHGESLPILEEHRHEFLRLFQLSLAREKSALATVLRPPG